MLFGNKIRELRDEQGVLQRQLAALLERDANLRNDNEQMKYGFIYKDAPTYEYLIDRLKTLQQSFRQLDWQQLA